MKTKIIEGLKLLPEHEHLKWEPLSDQHTEHIVKWRNAIENRRFFENQEPISNDTQREFLRNHDKYDRVDLVLLYDENPIGVFNIKNLSSHPEYGALIGNPNYRGKGIGSLAKKIILKLWFEILEQEQLFFKNRKNNHKAIASNLNKSFDLFEEDEYYITFKLDKHKYIQSLS